MFDSVLKFDDINMNICLKGLELLKRYGRNIGIDAEHSISHTNEANKCALEMAMTTDNVNGI